MQRQKHWKNWLKHSLSFRSAKHILNTEQQQQLSQAIEQAEHGHRGEIRIIIEGYLPSHIALYADCQWRAEQLFGQYRVWDTQYNSGVLLYLNLAAKEVKIVADRGIFQAIDPTLWQQMCDEMLPFFRDDNYSEGLSQAVEQLGEVFRAFYQDKPLLEGIDPAGNELDNRAILL